MKKRLIFKGCSVIKVPFLLTAITPWQNQIAEEMKKIQARFLPRKNVRWGFEINEFGAEINIIKVK